MLRISAENRKLDFLHLLSEQLDEVTRRLIFREEELFSQDAPSEEEEDQLQKDFESLSVQIWMAVHDTFSPSAPSGEVLRNAVDSIQQQEKQDQRWRERPKEKVPVWRPQRWLSSHHKLLQKMVEVRLSEAAESDSADTQQLSSDVKRQVCRMGKRLKEDLLMVARKVKDCYPVTMDILNVYGALYHQTFSARLAALTAAGLDIDDCSYVLFWVNHYYPEEILKHPDLEGQIKTPCLGSLLLQDNLRALEEQYLLHKEEKIQLWLNTLLKKEEESWLGDKHPELIDSYYFSPLAIDIIQVRAGAQRTAGKHPLDARWLYRRPLTPAGSMDARWFYRRLLALWTPTPAGSIDARWLYRRPLVLWTPAGSIDARWLYRRPLVL
uniref:Tumor necrosis factor, alpha-induced protein 2b n=1 Tax=Cyprinodon variegatus TaxID=28743 RepID=A0A3Q2FZZ8_CYPVA